MPCSRSLSSRSRPGTRATLIATLTLAACAHPSPSGSPTADRGSYDVVIENGRIVDGTGNPWTYGDVGIRGDSLAAASLLAGAPMWFSVIGGLMTAGLPNKVNDPCAR